MTARPGEYMTDGACQGCRATEDIVVLDTEFKTMRPTFRLCRECWGKGIPLLLGILTEDN